MCPAAAWTLDLPCSFVCSPFSLLQTGLHGGTLVPLYPFAVLTEPVLPLALLAMLRLCGTVCCWEVTASARAPSATGSSLLCAAHWDVVLKGLSKILKALSVLLSAHSLNCNFLQL